MIVYHTISFFLHWKLIEAISKRFQVSISGTGADEMMTGIMIMETYF